MYDLLTLEKIKLLHPSIREQVAKDYLEINRQLPKGVRLRITHTLRTPKEQNDLYALGRTVVNPIGKTAKKPMGNIVTNAKAGSSFHNFGVAFDVVILFDKDGNGTFETASYVLDKYFLKVVDFFKARGWQWGGDWKGKLYDAPHFQKTFGYKVSEMAVLPKTIDGKYPEL